MEGRKILGTWVLCRTLCRNHQHWRGNTALTCSKQSFSSMKASEKMVPPDYAESKAYFEKIASFPRRETGPSFKAKDLQVTLTQSPRWQEFVSGYKMVKFGTEFTDHMLTVNWTKEGGWEAPRIVPFGDFDMHPGCKVFHYALSCFDGMKAFRGDDGRLRLFRPWHNFFRFTNSTSRCCLPVFDERQGLELLCEFLKVEQNWIPSKEILGEGSSLYIRPNMMCITPTLGVDLPTRVMYFFILSPVQSYFGPKYAAVNLLADARYVRAARGGVGDCKLSANYAPSLRVQEEASKKGYQAVLWLYGKQEQITEVGMMNVFFLLENERGEKELVTPAIEDGLVLPGTTRRSVVELLKTWEDRDFKISERTIRMKEVADAAHKGKLFECFGTGTAAVILPVGSINWRHNCTFDVPTESKNGSLWKKIHKAITDIQYGRVPSDWAYVFG